MSISVIFASLADKITGAGQFKFKINNKSFDTGIIGLAVFLSCFLFSFVAGSLIIQPQATKAVIGLGLADRAPSISLPIDKTNISLDLNPSVNDGLASGSNTLTVSTNAPGYSLYLSELSNDSELKPTESTIYYPKILPENRWGFALKDGDFSSAFSSSYTTPTPDPASLWASPIGEDLIREELSVAGHEQTDVYYGANIDASLPPGTYVGNITYTALSNAYGASPYIVSIDPSSGSTAGGDIIEIVGRGFTYNDQSITTNVEIGIGNNRTPCAAVSISSNTPTIGLDTIYCTTPAHHAGWVDILIKTWAETLQANQVYNYIEPVIVSSVSPSLASTIPGSESGQAFTVVGSGFTEVNAVMIGDQTCTSFEVISDTQIFCVGPNSNNTEGAKVVKVSKAGIDSADNVTVVYSDANYPTLQSPSAYANCTTTAQLYRDIRDSQLYYVKKMPDNKCWMVDNLKYANFGELSQRPGEYLTADGTDTQNATNFDVAKYVDPGAADYCTGSTDMPANTNTRCGLLYNWYAATNGTGTYVLGTSTGTSGINVPSSICPANFRLPSNFSDGSTATGTGTDVAVADFPVLNASMNAGSLTTGWSSNFTYYTNWLPTGAWSGIYSGSWWDYLSVQSSRGFFWSSTEYFSSHAGVLDFGSSSVSHIAVEKFQGIAVRCVMDAPPAPPEGSNPDNISSTNPRAMDVYPTTGWAGDTVTITSNALFTDVTSVTIGGTMCTNYFVHNTSTITCELPLKTAGTNNDIAVTNAGSNVTPASTYTHMKVMYFNPNSNTVRVGSKNYPYYPNGFTTANCSAMTASNVAIGTEPIASLAYVRDTRNKQVYRVKKMVDNKCWMVDNLKYISGDMTYNNGDPNNTGNTDYAYKTNTVDGTQFMSDANINKKFFNNPMSTGYCYGFGGTMTYTLTHCGYLYNWYSATNGTGTYAQNIQGNQVAGNICPANFRLPSIMSDGSTSTGNGTSLNSADFAVLNASMNSGYFWSSTVDSAIGARYLSYYSTLVFPNDTASKYYGLAVRCVIK